MIRRQHRRFIRNSFLAVCGILAVIFLIAAFMFMRFVDSSIAYQAYGRGLGDAVGVINTYAVDDCMPDLTILLKLDPERGSNRIAGREHDRIEQASDAFHRRVYEGYLKLEEIYPERILGIDASGTIREIAEEISGRVNEIMSR